MDRFEPIAEEELHAWLDGELRSERLAAVSEYLASNPVAARRVADYDADRRAMRRVFGTYAAALTALQRPRRFAPALRWAAVIALTAGAYCSGAIVRDWQHGADNGFAREAAIAHAIYASWTLTPGPQDRVEPATALSRYLGRDVTLPAVTDLGLQLTALRLLSSTEPPALQLVYSGTSELVTVYLRPKPGATETHLEFTRHGGTTTASWDLDDLACAISGAVDPAVLRIFGQRLYDALDKS